MTFSKKKKIILVTGGGGFVGANLVRRLLKLNCNVHLLWKKTTNPWRINNIKDKISLHKVSLLNYKKLSSLIRRLKPFAIYHLAAHGAYPTQTNINQMLQTNIKGTLNLLFASKNIDYKIFVNTGSSSEYGFKKKAMKETDLLEPVSFYAATKASSTLLCQVFAKQYQKPIVTIRPFSVYGPYEEKDRFIPTIINSLIEQKLINLTPGSQRRDFIFIDDLIDCYIKLLQLNKELNGYIINSGTGIEFTNDQVVKILFDIAKRKTLIKKGTYPVRIWDTPHWKADISKTTKLLNWSPNFSLKEGLKKTYTWFLKNKHLYEKNY